MKFNLFAKKETLATGYYVVGYDENTGVEIRIPVGNLGTAGAAGASVDVQYSANASSWHYPDAEGDVYIRFKKGVADWSAAFKIKATETILLEYSADGATGWSETYTVGDAYMRINGGDAILFKGEPGDNAPAVQVAYSADGGSWHSSLQVGDIYIRFSVDNGGSWGDAILFKGEIDINALQEVQELGMGDYVIAIKDGMLCKIQKPNL